NTTWSPTRRNRSSSSPKSSSSDTSLPQQASPWHWIRLCLLRIGKPRAAVRKYKSSWALPTSTEGLSLSRGP
ncbi:uncharacterized protein H6S33_006748, partial [Morchella sextelata]|uniref:uncharacterized protein n=1 Tax=Morchella sextelata TaxID=1174677 RepID=UPI001D05447E